MYHISNDKRAARSAQKIGIGLLTCLKTKNFTEITVTDVQKASGVGRATFYRLFDNTSDVLSYLCDRIFEKINCDCKNPNKFNPKELSLKFIQEWMNNKILLQAIINCNRVDFIYNSHLKYIGEKVDFFFPDVPMSKEKLNYLLMTMTACTSACLGAWLKNGACETAEQLQEHLGSCFQTLDNIFY